MQQNRLLLVAFLALALASAQKLSLGQQKTPDGFGLPQPGHKFTFPRDYGSHDDFKIEWWYITGHLFADDGRRFGFQATFFRSANSPPNSPGPQDNSFQSAQLFLAHMALLDVRTGTYMHQQRLNRGGWDAFSATNALDTRNGNWSLRMTDTNPVTLSLCGTVNSGAGFQLRLKPRKPLVVFGQNSISRKAAEPSAASYYLTFPRLAAEGSVEFDSQSRSVRGQAWMDHEISSSQLGAGQAGWDWCCLQFNDGREIMAYRMRRKDGSQDNFSTLAWISAAGAVTHLPSTDFSMETLRTWKSPVSRASYPVSIKLKTHELNSQQPLALVLEPLAANQEITGPNSPSYWEGACRVRDAAGREIGSAFLELTGYAGGIQTSLR
jgi:predicted secreted hydrolase